ncbi:MAG: hypothetical protein WDZ51_12245 [Pirellulaceae bacterium]
MLPGRISAFVLGLLVGAAIVYGGLKYHFIRADDGIHVVPKSSAEFSDAYVDIRGWGVQQWNEHRGLAVAVAQAQKPELFQNTASETMRKQIDAVVEGLIPER